MDNVKYVNIKLVKSTIGRLPSHKATVSCLGLRKINHKVRVKDNPYTRGMISKVSYLLEVEVI